MQLNTVEKELLACGTFSLPRRAGDILAKGADRLIANGLVEEDKDKKSTIEVFFNITDKGKHLLNPYRTLSPASVESEEQLVLPKPAAGEDNPSVLSGLLGGGSDDS